LVRPPPVAGSRGRGMEGRGNEARCEKPCNLMASASPGQWACGARTGAGQPGGGIQNWRRRAPPCQYHDESGGLRPCLARWCSQSRWSPWRSSWRYPPLPDRTRRARSLDYGFGRTATPRSRPWWSRRRCRTCRASAAVRLSLRCPSGGVSDHRPHIWSGRCDDRLTYCAREVTRGVCPNVETILGRTLLPKRAYLLHGGTTPIDLA